MPDVTATFGTCYTKTTDVTNTSQKQYIHNTSKFKSCRLLSEMLIIKTFQSWSAALTLDLNLALSEIIILCVKLTPQRQDDILLYVFTCSRLLYSFLYIWLKLNFCIM